MSAKGAAVQVFLFLVFASLFLPTSSLAQRRVCSGKIYYTPCPAGTIEGQGPAGTSRSNNFKRQSEKPRVEIKQGERPMLILRERRVTKYPRMKILNPKLERQGNGYGLWWRDNNFVSKCSESFLETILVFYFRGFKS